jgi:hypothetical protein
MMGSSSSTKSQSRINCPIGLFGPQEDKIETITKLLNAAPTPSQKAPFAQELVDEVGVLLMCRSYDPDNVNCGLCRGFSELRMQTANLVLKMAGSGAAS